MQHRGDDELDKGVLVDGVGQSVPVISAITLSPLAEFRVRLVGLRNPSLAGNENERRIINAVEHRSLELFLHRLRRKMFICAHCAEVGDDVKNALRLSSLGEWIDGRPRRGARWWWLAGSCLNLLLNTGAWIIGKSRICNLIIKR